MNEWCVCAAIRRTHATTAVRVRPSSFSPTFLSLFSFASSPSFVFPLHSSPSPSFSFLLQFSSFAFLHFTFLTLTLFFFLSHACARFARTKLLWLWFFRRCTWISKQIESMTHNDKRIFLYSNILFLLNFKCKFCQSTKVRWSTSVTQLSKQIIANLVVHLGIVPVVWTGAYKVSNPLGG